MFISHSSKHPFFEMVPEQKSCSEPLKESIQEQNKGNIQSENDTCYIFDLELWQWEKEESNIGKHAEIKRKSMPVPDISSLFSRELPFVPGTLDCYMDSVKKFAVVLDQNCFPRDS